MKENYGGFVLFMIIYSIILLLTFSIGVGVGKNSMSCLDSEDSFVKPSNPRFIYLKDGWMVDLQEEQSVTMKEALRRSVR